MLSLSLCCPVCCVPCPVSCSRCPVSRVPCPVSRLASCVPCPVSCVLCPVSCFPCPVSRLASCVPCPLSCVPCPVSRLPCPAQGKPKVAVQGNGCECFTPGENLRTSCVQMVMKWVLSSDMLPKVVFQGFVLGQVMSFVRVCLMCERQV